METSKQQTLPFGEIESMCCRADSPVNRSARRGKEKARKTTATSGPKCSELFDLFDPVGSWGRTFSELLIGRKDWFSNRCVLTWKRKDTRCNRSLYQLVASMPRTGGIEHGLSQGLWKTPVASDAADRNFYVNSRGEPQLSAQAQLGFPASGKQWKGMLPTVQTQGLKVCDGNGKTQFYPVELLPTPSAAEATNYTRIYNPASQMGRSLTALAVNGMLPTPTARDFKGARTKEALEKSGRSNKNNLPDQFARTGKTSRLNPRFVAEMMGFPTDWTELPSRNGEKNRSKPTAMR